MPRAIPKTIHQIWFQGEANLPPLYSAYSRLLRATNPGWQHRLWDDGSLRKECLAMGARYADQYDSYRIMHQKIDFGRYVVAYRHGGVTVDMDTVAVKPLDDLPVFDRDHEFGHTDKLILSDAARVSLMDYNVMRLSAGFMPVTKAKTGLFVNNAVVICAPGAALLKDLIDAMTHLTQRSTDSQLSAIQKTTGPLAVSEILDSFGPQRLERDLEILDRVYFEPCFGAMGDCKPSPETVVFHKHDGTWLDDGFHEGVAFVDAFRRIAMLQVLLIVGIAILVMAIVFFIGWRRCRAASAGCLKK